MYIIDNIDTLFIGYQGENETRTISIDVSSWINEFPQGQIAILHSRPTEENPYIVANSTVNDGILEWLVNSADVGIEGMGYAVIQMSYNEQVLKTAVFTTKIGKTLDGTISPTPTPPAPSWVTDILNSRAEQFNINEQGHLIVTKVDGTTEDLGIVKGDKGDKGDTGATGQGVPNGGTTGQVLKKKSNADFDTEWANESGGGGGGTSDYPDLTNKPSINNVELVGNKTTSDLGLFSGAYTDLSGKPTKLSDFTNDSGFITKVVNDLTNYYLKSDTYTKAEVNSLIGAITAVSFEVVVSLPTQDIQTNVIYLVPKATAQTQNVYDEYVYINNAWEKIGDTQIDLSGYATKVSGATADNFAGLDANGNLKDSGKKASDFATPNDLLSKQDVIDGNNKLPYAYVSGTPTIPSKTSDLTNDSGFLSENDALSVDSVEIDNTPTQNSNNLITSGAVFGAVNPHYELIEKIIIGYSVTTQQPEDWATNYIDYFTNTGTIREPIYTAVTGESAPTWQSGTYYSYQSGGVQILDVYKEPDGTDYSFKHLFLTFEQGGTSTINGAFFFATDLYPNFNTIGGEHYGGFVTALNYASSQKHIIRAGINGNFGYYYNWYNAYNRMSDYSDQSILSTQETAITGWRLRRTSNGTLLSGTAIYVYGVR